jgi:Cu2+-exporting ATPase
MKNTYGLSIMIVSGDQPRIVSKIADTLGITEWHAEKKPIEKYTIVHQLNSKSLMVGDGLNDAVALEASFVSMSPTSSLEIAQVRSDIVFHGRKLTPILLTYNRALLARKLVNQNFLLSFGYNIISIPLAMLGLLNPIIAAIMMSSSSIIVMLNALRATRE